jgi:ElaB/YqjD/DUF883 family membrane-anchored ribosome-binding protein
MSDPLSLLAQRIAATRSSRSAVRDRAARTVQRLSPAQLANDAKRAASDLAKETGEQVRRHPFTAVGAIAALLAVTFHRPLGRIADRLIDQWLPLPESLSDEDADSARSVLDGQDEHSTPPPTEHDT